MKIRKFKQSDTEQAASLISRTFAKFNRKEGSKKAVQWYVDMYNPKKTDKERIKDKFLRTNIFFVAVDNDRTIGLIRGNKERIINLYVDGKYHKKGIAKELIKKFEKECVKEESQEIKVNASQYATPFYQKMGYKRTTGLRNFHGIQMQPMKKILG